MINTVKCSFTKITESLGYRIQSHQEFEPLQN